MLSLVNLQFNIHGQCDQGLRADGSGCGFGGAEPAGLASTERAEVILAVGDFKRESCFKQTFRKVSVLHDSI